MSILKSILHHWNKTTSSYDTLHPETEVAQITDWSQGVANTLASTALGSLISTLSSDSLAAKIMKLVLDATGVKYLVDKDEDGRPDEAVRGKDDDDETRN